MCDTEDNGPVFIPQAFPLWAVGSFEHADYTHVWLVVAWQRTHYGALTPLGIPLTRPDGAYGPRDIREAGECLDGIMGASDFLTFTTADPHR